MEIFDDDDDNETVVGAACMCFRHDYGLMTPEERKALEYEAKEWLRAWQKALKHHNADRQAGQAGGAYSADTFRVNSYRTTPIPGVRLVLHRVRQPAEGQVGDKGGSQ
jgi:hypothetical protein